MIYFIFRKFISQGRQAYMHHQSNWLAIEI